MDLTSVFNSSSVSLSSEHDFSIQSEQDGLFFGSEFLKDFLKPEDSPLTSDLKLYFQDGDCIFKDQILFKVCLKGSKVTSRDLCSLVSYFSGAYTLISCWTERNFDFAIKAGLTPDFFLSKWEEQAVLRAGAFPDSLPENICFEKEDVYRMLDMGKKKITLSDLQMPKEEIQGLLKMIPSFVECSLHGSLSPSDLEAFRSCSLKSVYPLRLQGFFPSLKMSPVDS